MRSRSTARRLGLITSTRSTGSDRSVLRTRQRRPGPSSHSAGAVLDDVETIAAYAQDMSEFLTERELTERRAFIETFVKEIVVTPGDVLLRYTIPMPDDSCQGRREIRPYGVDVQRICPP